MRESAQYVMTLPALSGLRGRCGRLRRHHDTSAMVRIMIARMTSAETPQMKNSSASWPERYGRPESATTRNSARMAVKATSAVVVWPCQKAGRMAVSAVVCRWSRIVGRGEAPWWESRR
jgi:hypothetical protein